MYILFPWPAILALAVALIITTLLAWRNHRQIEQLRQDRDHAIRDGARKYAQGHADGLSLGYERATAQIRRSREQDFLRGYDECLADMQSQQMEQEQPAIQRAATA